MNWLTNIVRPKIRALVGAKEVPDNLWQKCQGCGQMLFQKDVDANAKVCPLCGYHFRIAVKRRLEMLYDDGRYTILPTPPVAIDPLKFKDKKRYSDRLRDAHAKGHTHDAILVTEGKIDTMDVVIAAFDFEFMGGSMGQAVGEGLVLASDRALMKKVPLIAIPASGGARMQEGILSLMQMARSTVGAARVKEAGLPYIVLLTDPTTGGVSASFAMLGNVTIAEPGAVIGFAGARVIEETIRQKLPDGFQKAEYLLDHGMVDMVVKRSDLKAAISNLIALLYYQKQKKTTALPKP